MGETSGNRAILSGRKPDFVLNRYENSIQIHGQLSWKAIIQAFTVVQIQADLISDVSITYLGL